MVGHERRREWASEPDGLALYLVPAAARVWPLESQLFSSVK